MRRIILMTTLVAVFWVLSYSPAIWGQQEQPARNLRRIERIEVEESARELAEEQEKLIESEERLTHVQRACLEQLEPVTFECLDDLSFLDESLSAGLSGLEASLEGLQHLDFHLDLSGVSESLDALGSHLECMHFDIPPLPPLAIPPMPPLPDLEIPPIPPLPPVIFPSIECDWHWDAEWFDDFGQDENLTEDEQVRMQALAALAQNSDSDAVPLVDEILQGDENPVMRYYALKILYWVDDERLVPMLIKAAKNDQNVRVRKLAIRYLGESGDDRAAVALKELVE